MIIKGREGKLTEVAVRIRSRYPVLGSEVEPVQWPGRRRPAGLAVPAVPAGSIGWPPMPPHQARGRKTPTCCKCSFVVQCLLECAEKPRTVKLKGRTDEGRRRPCNFIDKSSEGKPDCALDKLTRNSSDERVTGQNPSCEPRKFQEGVAWAACFSAILVAITNI